MALQSTGAISLANIQTVFGGTNPISLSEYYANANPSYTSGVSGIPNIGSAISLSQFYGKAKPVVGVNYMLAGNVAGNMSTAGGIELSSIRNVDDSSASIGTVGFSFFFFGTDYNNNIFWSTNQVLQFGTNVGTINWSSSTGRGILLGNADRRTNTAHQFSSYTSNNHSIKKIIIDHDNWYSSDTNDIKMEIRLIRGPQYQYVEVRINDWRAAQGGVWTFANSAAAFIDIFNPSRTGPPTGSGGSFVLRSDLNGNGWQFFNNHYINL
jgi:hypothetical protein